jgi:hypothetical protein
VLRYLQWRRGRGNCKDSITESVASLPNKIRKISTAKLLTEESNRITSNFNLIFALCGALCRRSKPSPPPSKPRGTAVQKNQGDCFVEKARGWIARGCFARGEQFEIKSN